MKTLQQLAELAEKATPQDFDSAETVKHGGYVECPCCNGDGEVELLSEYTNYDDVAIGVQFFGIGDAHLDAEEYYRACNPETIIAIAKQHQETEDARDHLAYRLGIADETNKGLVGALKMVNDSMYGTKNAMRESVWEAQFSNEDIDLIHAALALVDSKEEK